MVSTDPISDMLTRIRNAINVRKNEVYLPHSKIKANIAQLLKDNNFIDGVEIVDGEGSKKLKLTIHDPDQNARITEIVRLSRPGKRLYAPYDKMPIVKRGRGVIIVSTSKGVMTGGQARHARVGGELICKVY